MSYELTLSNGRKLSGLDLCGNTWVSSESLSAEDFRGGLRNVKISGDAPAEGESDPRGEYARMTLDGLFTLGEKVCFVLSEAEENEVERLRSDVDYMAMMMEVEL